MLGNKDKLIFELKKYRKKYQKRDFRIGLK
jgi:hypothetical protein